MVNVEKACGSKCRSRQHASQLVIAASKAHNLKQFKLFLSTCHNATTHSDHFGRTVLHMVASCGNVMATAWLVEEQGVELNTKDLESGWTALHRAAFYGQITTARLLIQHNASLLTRDREGLTALDLIMKDRLPYVQFERSGLQEVYTWGDNANFNLGHENEHRRRQPEMLDFFRKRSISIKQVSMNKYHTMFLSMAGHVYTCGHGRGGRLGLGSQNTVLEPTLVESLKNDPCAQVFAARDHSLFLMESGALYSCGMNDYMQLGQFPPPESCLLPKLVNGKMLKGREIKGVCANRFHTVVYTHDAVFTFGLNAGQLGHQRVGGESHVTQPRQVSALAVPHVRIERVTCSQAATLVYTARGDVLALHEYQCRKIVSKKLSVVQVAVTGGNLDHSLDAHMLSEAGGGELVIALLNLSGQVFIWRSSDPCVRRCAWASKRSIHVTQLALSITGLACITKDGDAFTASLPKVKSKPTTEKSATSKTDKDHLDNPWSLAELVSRDDILELSIEKLGVIHRATQITCDVKGCNYAVLQCQPNACLTEVPLIEGSNIQKDFRNLLCEVDESDNIHDCILQFHHETIVAHRFILSQKSEHFAKIFNDNTPLDEEISTIDLRDTNLALFKEFLTYCYTESCVFLELGSTIQLDKFVDRTSGYEQVENGHGYIEIGAGDVKKSAYHIYSTQKKNKKGGSKKHVDKIDSANSARNVLEAFTELAKKFTAKTLLKKLESLKLSKSGVIELTKEQFLVPAQVRFDRHAQTHLCDVTIQTSDNKLLQAHRCVLVARSEYFRSMLASGWIETSTAVPLSMPVPGDILEVTLEYLYTDNSLVIESCEDAEFLINVLVVADQLLLTRLRQLCEVACASQINLKNACELLELSTFYNAHQLVITCQQFLCHNLAALLESRALDVLTDPVLSDLTQYYRDMIPGMARRRITPYSGWPSLADLERLQEEGKTPSKHRTSSKPDEPAGSVAKKNKAAKKNRARKKSENTRESICEADGKTVDNNDEEKLMDKSLEENDAPQVTTPTSPAPQEPVPVILTESRPTLQHTRPSDNTTPIAPPEPTTPKSPILQSSWAAKSKPLQDEIHVADGAVKASVNGTQMSGLRDIMQEQEKNMSLTGPHLTQQSKTKKVGKLSQRERKKLALEAAQQKSRPAEESVHDITVSNGAKPKAWATPGNAWGQPTPHNKVNLTSSFKQLVIAEQQVEKPATKTPLKVHIPQEPSPQSKQVLSFGLASRRSGPEPTKPTKDHALVSPPPSTGNPWRQMPTTPTSPVVAEQHVPQSFNAILRDETQQKESYHKVVNKPLNLIQIEELAIQELRVHYERQVDAEVRVSVQRVANTLASPTWRANQGTTYS